MINVNKESKMKYEEFLKMYGIKDIRPPKELDKKTLMSNARTF